MLSDSKLQLKYFLGTVVKYVAPLTYGIQTQGM